MGNPVDLLALQARLQPGRLAAVDLASGRRWTHAGVDRAINQAVARLARHGIRLSDRVAVLAKNRVELALLHFACARLGAIYVPLNWRLSAPELRTIVADAEPALVLGDASLATAGLDGVPLDEFARELDRTDPAEPAPIDSDRPSLILYTSGTSGRPKGVVLTERNLTTSALSSCVMSRVTHESAFLVDAPMFHVIGLVANLRPALMQGGAVLISDGFNPARTLERLGDPALGATHYFCVPQMAAALRAERSYDSARFRRLTALFTGGAPHPAANIRSWLADGIPVVDGFGMSEAGTVFGMPVDRALIDAHAGSVGLATPRLAQRIVDANGRDCAPGEAGELLLKGDSITRGYWRLPDETKAAFTGDGWFRTGDVFRADPEGYHWLVDRLKDMYISGGENVYPAEIEAALAGHPGVSACAVVGIPDERWGESGHLFIEPAGSTRPDERAVMAHLEGKLARYKLPKRISLIDALPRNGAGKVLKILLRTRRG